MPAPRFRIMDADGHVMEPIGMWERYIDPAFRDRAPRITREADGRTRFECDGRRLPRLTGPNSLSEAMRRVFASRVREWFAESQDAGYDAASQVKAMDEGGIEIAFLYPTQGLYTASIDDLDPGLAIAICAAYNDWILDFCAHAPDRLKPVAMLSGLHDHKWPETVERMLSMPLDDRVKRKVLWDNPLALYGGANGG